MRNSLVIAFFICLSVYTLRSQDGVIDSSFYGTGKRITAIGGSHDYGASVLVQPDGKIVVAGQSYVFNKFNFSAARFNANGSLDTSFDADGTVLSSNEPYSCGAVSAAAQADGKIVLGGFAHTSDGTGSYFSLIRYYANGTVDSTFGTDGRVTTSVRTAAGYDECRSIAVQKDGKIIAVGYSDTVYSVTSHYHIAVVRYNTNGSLDQSFSGDGRLTTAIGGSNDYGWSVAVQNDGKIVVAGSTKKNDNDDIVVVRYTTDGSLDQSFGTSGIVTTAVGTGNDAAKAVAVLPDGKIVVAGTASMKSSDFAVVRYTPSGVPDSSFHLNGKVTADILTNSFDYGQGMVVQSDGKIVVVGAVIKSNVYFTFDFALVRFTTAGYLDATFGSGGKVTTAFGGDQVSAQAICAAVQPNGSIIAAGYTGGNADFAVARYRRLQALSAGSVDHPLPSQFFLEQNYPNPFNPTTAINYQLSAAGLTILKIYDALGREIAVLVDEVKEAGTYTVQFDGAALSGGIYFARLASGGETRTRKLVLLK